MYVTVFKLPLPADTEIIGFAANGSVVIVATYPENITQNAKTKPLQRSGGDFG